jgi:ribosome-binding protein aMBF1 (putative translation factor)
LTRSGPFHSLAYASRAFRFYAALHFTIRKRRHLHSQINTIQQGTGKTLLIPPDFSVAALANMRPLGAKPAAWTNVQLSTSTDSPVLFTTTHSHNPLDITDSLSAGERITKLRDFRGWSKATLSARANLSIPIIRACETGNIVPSVSTAKKLADALRVPNWYVGGYDHLPQKTLTEKMEKARKYRGHTKEEMAAELGVNQKSIYNWAAKGVRPLPETEKKLSLYIAVLKK